MHPLKHFFYLLFFVSVGFAQKSIESTLNRFNKKSVPYISVEQLSTQGEVVLLDTRKKEEYKVSHLKNAIWVGHKTFSLDGVMRKLPDKNTSVVVYCSIGVRSENIGEKLLAAGFTDVKNLYGGIFEWKNKGNAVYDTEGEETNAVHAYDRKWGKLLTKAEKVYDP